MNRFGNSAGGNKKFLTIIIRYEEKEKLPRHQNVNKIQSIRDHIFQVYLNMLIVLLMGTCLADEVEVKRSYGT